MNLIHRQLGSLAALAAATLMFSACSSTKYAEATKAYSSGDYATAYQEYLALAKGGDVRAQGTVACMIQAGEGVSSDPAKALPWYTKAAEQGLEPAQYSLGLAYENGLGTGRDLAKALVWYGKAAEHGDSKAVASVNRLKAPGAGVSETSPAVITAPARSAATGTTGLDTVNAKPVTVKKTSTAVKVAGRPAAQTEVAPASLPAKARVVAEPVQSMPELIFKTQPPEQGVNQKIADKRNAAESGDVDAQLYLGWCYSTGKDVAVDKPEAVKWYRKAAEAGRLNAQTALGWIYFSGEGGRQDLKESAKWYRKAAAQGDAKAKKMLKRLEAQGGKP
jgi:uncharacterized protein